MKNTLLKTIVGAALLGFAALALTASPYSANSGSPTDSGSNFYLLGQIGLGKMHLEEHSFSDDWGFAGRLGAGYLWNLKNQWKLGVEAGLMKYFDVELEDQDVDLGGYVVDLLAVCKYSFNNQWNIFGKLGAAYTDQAFSSEVFEGEGTFSVSRDHTEPEAQIGLGYDFNKNLGVSLTYIYTYGETDVDPDKALKFPMHAVMAGVEYHIV